MNVTRFITSIVLLLVGTLTNPAAGQTYCNPVDLAFPLDRDKPVLPDLADPTVVLFKNSYFLFATNAGGYWSSDNLLAWKFIDAPRLPLEKEEPTATVIGDWLYFFTSRHDTIYRSQDPVHGKWEAYSASILIPELSDFAIFADTDGRVYSYYGCSNNDGVMSREMDAANFLRPIKVPVVCQKMELAGSVPKKVEAKPVKKHGTYVRGSWMNKYNGTYYYQNLEATDNQNSFSYMVYQSQNPQGPFKFAANNPFVYRPNGFLCIAGSGSTFEDRNGNWWHITTVSSPGTRQRKTALALFPAEFDRDGNLFVQSDFGDYPIAMPGRKNQNTDKIYPGWSLLADHLTAEVSSDQGMKTAAFAIDENLDTYWKALSGKKGEWLKVDLGSSCQINAFQINFALDKPQSLIEDSIRANRFLVEYSQDGRTWQKLSNHTRDSVFRPNLYEALKFPVLARYLKITNFGVPTGNFAIADFRVFGLSKGKKPKKVNDFKAIRDYKNPHQVKLFWKKQGNTTGYNIRFGTDKDKLYHSYQVYRTNKVTIPCPDKHGTYWFEIDAFNQNGISEGKPMMIK